MKADTCHPVRRLRTEPVVSNSRFTVVAHSVASEIQVVWFKRDLRTTDHAPLFEASQRGPVLPLYIFEPSIAAASDFDRRHLHFISESLVELDDRLRELGQPLILRVGEAVPVLETLRKTFRHITLWSHEETGNALTYARDRNVAQWATTNRVSWKQLPQNGVIRGLRDRNRWSSKWEGRMAQQPLPTPTKLQPVSSLSSEPKLPHLECADSAPILVRQNGGATAARHWLSTFFAGRGGNYRRGMSSPIAGATTCSRISPYLAWGCLSIREAYHAAERAHCSDQQQIPIGAIQSFLGRLHWHCHFIQKLESEPAIEFHAFHKGLEHLRDDQPPDAHIRLSAWYEGFTGYPFVDACMRSLRATGWLNFRMRAMLVSFAAYDLWLDWRSFKDPLARLFLDYEPGIHISQCQMQSGTTGINTLRIYNPVKQGLEYDPQGHFIRKWVPELRDLEADAIHMPWKAHRRPTTYPPPIVSHTEAVREARRKIAAARRLPEFSKESERVFMQHGSRKHRDARQEARERAIHGDFRSEQKLRIQDSAQTEFELFAKF